MTTFSPWDLDKLDDATLDAFIVMIKGNSPRVQSGLARIERLKADLRKQTYTH